MNPATATHGQVASPSALSSTSSASSETSASASSSSSSTTGAASSSSSASIAHVRPNPTVTDVLKSPPIPNDQLSSNKLLSSVYSFLRKKFT